jgi:hypothetical protein
MRSNAVGQAPQPQTKKSPKFLDGDYSMTAVDIKFNELNLNSLTLVLRQDSRGYYWEAESGKDATARFASAGEALERLADIWSMGFDSLSEQSRFKPILSARSQYLRG